MEMKYRLKGMKLSRQSKCVGDLVRYYGDIRFTLLDKVRKIQSNATYSAKFLDLLRQHSSAGITLDNLITGLETISNMEIFRFKMNGKNPCECFSNEDIDLEIYMNPMYFTALAAIYNAMTPERILKVSKKEEEKWIYWFEKELNKYHPSSLWEKSVLKE